MGMLGGTLGAIGAKKSGKQQERAAKKAREQYVQLHQEGVAVRKQIDPWSTKTQADGKTGAHAAGDELYDLLFGGGDYQLSAAGKFATEQGNKAIKRQASAKGMRNSGNVLYELGEHTTGVASQDYWANIQNLMQLSGANNMLGAAQLQLNTSTVARQGIAASEIQIGQAKAAQTGAIFSGIQSVFDGAKASGVGGFMGSLGSLFGS